MKRLFAVAITVVLLALSVVAYAAPIDEQGLASPWDDESVKLCVVETYSSMPDGVIDIGKEPFWSGTYFSVWPEAEWQDGKLVFTNCAGPVSSYEERFLFPQNEGTDRFTFRIASNEMNNSVEIIKKSIGMGFYIENNTAVEQSIGFYAIGNQRPCAKSITGTPIYFVSTEGEYVVSTVDDSLMAIIPAGAKGYVYMFYRDVYDLWQYSGEKYGDCAEQYPITCTGFELTWLVIDGSKGESIVIDDFFVFGEDVTENLGNVVINRNLKAYTEATPEPEITPEITPDITEQVTEEATTEPVSTVSTEVTPTPTQGNEGGISTDVILYIIAGAVAVVAVVVVLVLLKKKK